MRENGVELTTSSKENTMATAQSITTDQYKLFPSTRNRHKAIFQHQVFLPYPYMLIDLESYHFKGKYSLFAAYRISDEKMGQLVTLDLPEDEAKFMDRFVPD